MSNFPTDLLNGYRAFREGRYVAESQRYRELAEKGQEPKTLVIACCDSRTAPETIFDCGPGEIFAVRSIANLVTPHGAEPDDPATAAALEFAVQALAVHHVIVLGHARCGGIKAALAAGGTPLSPDDFIGGWMQPLQAAAGSVASEGGRTAAERQTALERISIRQSIANLRTFPWIKAREDDGKLKLHGAWFDISAGELWVMDPATGDFARPEI